MSLIATKGGACVPFALKQIAPTFSERYVLKVCEQNGWANGEGQSNAMFYDYAASSNADYIVGFNEKKSYGNLKNCLQKLKVRSEPCYDYRYMYEMPKQGTFLVIVGYINGQNGLPTQFSHALVYKDGVVIDTAYHSEQWRPWIDNSVVLYCRRILEGEEIETWKLKIKKFLKSLLP